MPNVAPIAVRESSLLSVDVSELLRHPGARKPVQFRGSVGGLSLPLARVPDDTELTFDLRVDALVDGIHVTGTVTGDVVGECRRCLRDVVQPAKVTLDAVYLPEGEGDEDAYTLQDEEIDLEPAVRDAVVLSLPLNPLCRDECKGLCAVCGADRNESDCGHGETNVDIRWEALERFRRQLEE